MEQNPNQNNTSKYDLQYLINPSHFNKICKKNNMKTDTETIAFYKERIIELTTNMLNGEKPYSLNNEFQKYISDCIKYFEFIDKTSILQEEEHTDISSNNTSLPDLSILDNTIDMRKVKNPLINTNPNDMQQFTTISKSHIHNHIFPQQKKDGSKEIK